MIRFLMTDATFPTAEELYSAQKTKFAFDPTYGFTLEQLLKIQMTDAEPVDFDDFWEKTYAENATVPLKWEERPCDTHYTGFKLTEIYFDTLNGWRVGAWLCRPENSKQIRRAVVMGHGYGGRENIKGLVPDSEAAMLFICAPGFHLSADPARVASNDSWKHVICGIESPKTYILRDCAAAFWSAAALMTELYPDHPLFYQGGSFGGGMGTLMLPWEKRFVGAELVQPTFSNHPFRVNNPSHGSAEAVRQLYLQKPEIVKTLAYYDSVFAARRIRVPVVFGLSIFDPCVAAVGQFSAANSVSPELATRIPTLFGHTDVAYPQSTDEWKRHGVALREVFARGEKIWQSRRK